MLARFRLPLLTALVAMVGLWIVIGSQSFQTCIHEHKNDKAYNGLKDDSITNRFFARRHLQFDCAGDAIDKHNAAVTALATVFIAFFTLTLWNATTDQAVLTRRSINVAERALTELERPFIYSEVTRTGLQIMFPGCPGGAGIQRDVFELTFFNYGRTPANLTRIEYGLVAAQRGGIADPVDPNVVGGRELPIGTVSASARPYSETTPMRLHFFDEETDIAEGRLSVWLVGFVRYDDIFGAHYITGFAKVLDPVGNRFVARGGQQYNYARSEEVTDIPPPSSRT